MNPLSCFSRLRLALLGLVLGSGMLLNACGGGTGSVSGDATATPVATAPPPTTTPTTPTRTAAASATAIGVATGNAVSANIGPAGGRLSSPDGKLVLTVPAGALVTDTLIGIQPFTNLAHGKIGGAFQLTPEGQTFLKPVTLTFSYTDQDLHGTAVEALGAAFQTREGFWQWIGGAVVNTVAKTISVSLAHFTLVSLTAHVQLEPGDKTVKVKGTVDLRVLICYPLDLGNGQVTLGNVCTPEDFELSLLNTVTEWTVNGTVNGGGVFGTVRGNGLNTALYTAPNTAPIPNVVRVSARVKLGAIAVIVFSYITIEDPALKVDGTYWDKYQLTGVICSLEKPFTLQAKANLAGALASGVFSFTPDETVGGTWRYAGVIEGFASYSGNGRYQLNGAGTESPALQMDPGNGTWLAQIPRIGVGPLGNGNHLEVQQTITTTLTEPCEKS